MPGKKQQENARRYFLKSDYHSLYEESVNSRSDFSDSQTTWHMKLIDPQVTERVLDVGVGSGRFVLACARAGVRDIAGIDISEEALVSIRGTLKKENLSVELSQADAGHLPFGEESFDKVVCLLTSQYVPDKDTLHAELSRVCRPGGKLLIDCPDKSKRRVYIEYRIRVLFNGIFPILLRLHLATTGKKLAIFLARRYKQWKHISRPNKYLQEPAIASVFTYGVTPYYPLRRKEIERLLTKHGFSELRFFSSSFGPNQITVVAKRSGGRS